MIQPTRRFLITGGAAALFAPAIVRVASIMPVKSLPPEFDMEALYEARVRVAVDLLKQFISDELYKKTGRLSPFESYSL